MKGENDQMSSRSLVNSRILPAITPAKMQNGRFSHAPCTAEGTPTMMPPSAPASGPPITPVSTALSNDRSAARKFGVVMRTTTPSANGMPIQRTR